jgi:UDP-glucose 4-epimerase
MPGSSARPPKVLITGGAGYIGSHAAHAFLDRGWSVVIVDDLSTGSRSRVPAAAEFIEMDCADPAVAAIIRDRSIDAAVHFAARIKVDESVADPLGYYKANVCTARAFFENAHLAGLEAMVFSSTAAVYGDAGETAVREDAPTRPESPYGRSKLATEWILADLSAVSPLRHVILRYFNVAGADPAGRSGPAAESQHLLKIAAEAAVGVRPGMQIHGTDYPTPDGTCVRDYVHVTDLAEAHVSAVMHLLGGGESLVANVGYGHGMSVRAVIAEALRLADRPFAVTGRAAARRGSGFHRGRPDARDGKAGLAPPARQSGSNAAERHGVGTAARGGGGSPGVTLAMVPDVSVIIPAWNAEATLAETVGAQQRRPTRAIEIIIVDDGSTDRTGEIAEGLCAADQRISLVRQANGGVAAARNAGLARARGEWAAWLDADDLWHPDKIARQLAAARAAPKPPAFVYSGYRVIDEAGTVKPLPRTLVDLSGETLCRQIASTYFTNVSSLMAPVALARDCGGHDPLLRAEGLEGAEDLLLQLRLAMRGPALCVPEALVGYRMHGANMSRAISRAARSNLRVLELVAAEAPEVPPWVFRLGRARTSGFALQMMAAGSPAAGTTFLAGLARRDASLTLRMLTRAAGWVGASAMGRRPSDPGLGRPFVLADPRTVPFEGPMLLSPAELRRLEAADRERAGVPRHTA